ncbi:hypothetical protein CIHG_06103 [Coccidioides immitis H538.4]|uniref:Uncharacterized protein n=2 Tax=Coccidioides immitis TaxID=5501 RepID=A0A0J8RSW5_COCIT|nr:hypothetical protein CIRG_00044 [Coccidioides immitis RMSCC 2394]KMU88305.1 hypothetical protein CIHG_06103 [Coccidioides immitis H538.4]
MCRVMPFIKAPALARIVDPKTCAIWQVRLASLSDTRQSSRLRSPYEEVCMEKPSESVFTSFNGAQNLIAKQIPRLVAVHNPYSKLQSTSSLPLQLSFLFSTGQGVTGHDRQPGGKDLRSDLGNLETWILVPRCISWSRKTLFLLRSLKSSIDSHFSVYLFPAESALTAVQQTPFVERGTSSPIPTRQVHNASKTSPSAAHRHQDTAHHTYLLVAQIGHKRGTTATRLAVKKGNSQSKTDATFIFANPCQNIQGNSSCSRPRPQDPVQGEKELGRRVPPSRFSWVLLLRGRISVSFKNKDGPGVGREINSCDDFIEGPFIRVLALLTGRRILLTSMSQITSIFALSGIESGLHMFERWERGIHRDHREVIKKAGRKIVVIRIADRRIHCCTSSMSWGWGQVMSLSHAAKGLIKKDQVEIQKPV